MAKMGKVILAYSGGLDTSVILKWLDLQGYEVYAYVADVGQPIDKKEVTKKAMLSGAKDVLIDDLKDEFVSDFVNRSIKFNALYEGRYYLGTSLARPIIAKGMADYAKKVGAKFFSHGATGKGNDQVRFELTIAALNPKLKVIAPWRMPEFFEVIKGRQEAIDFAKQHKIPIKATKSKPWSSDENSLHISFEAGILEDPNVTPPDNMFEYTLSPKKAKSKPDLITLSFEKGVAVKLNNKKMSPAEILVALNKLGHDHGIGRIDMVESRYVGMKSRGVYETPGGTILMNAHRDMESITLDGSVINLKETLMPRFATLVYNGYWYSEEMDCLNALLEKSQEFVTGEVRLELYRGNVTPIGRTSEYSLYNMQQVSMDDDQGAYNQADATGFIRLHSLPLIATASRRKK